jgi:hypothetical protein
MAQDHARANVLPRVASILSMLDQLGLFPLISSHTTLFNLPVRRSERIKRQEMGGMKIADKAHMAARKKIWKVITLATRIPLQFWTL